MGKEIILGRSYATGATWISKKDPQQHSIDMSVDDMVKKYEPQNHPMQDVCQSFMGHYFALRDAHQNKATQNPLDEIPLYKRNNGTQIRVCTDEKRDFVMLDDTKTASNGDVFILEGDGKPSQGKLYTVTAYLLNHVDEKEHVKLMKNIVDVTQDIRHELRNIVEMVEEE